MQARGWHRIDTAGAPVIPCADIAEEYATNPHEHDAGERQGGRLSPLERDRAEAQQQILNTASMPFVFKHVAVMPDCHYGKGATVGTVLPPKAPSFPPRSAWTSAAG